VLCHQDLISSLFPTKPLKNRAMMAHRAWKPTEVALIALVSGGVEGVGGVGLVFVLSVFPVVAGGSAATSRRDVTQVANCRNIWRDTSSIMPRPNWTMRPTKLMSASTETAEPPPSRAVTTLTIVTLVDPDPPTSLASPTMRTVCVSSFFSVSVLNCEFLGGLGGSSAVSALKQPFNAECAENAQRTAEKHPQIETSRLWTNVALLQKLGPDTSQNCFPAAKVSFR
jgi:hypothetical protein